jgi:hypothetical protein
MRLLFTFTLGMLVVACEPAPVVATEADEPDIWIAALAHERADDPDATPFLLDETVDANTTPFEGASLAAQLPDLEASTLASFEARAHDAAPLNLTVPDGYTLVGVDDTPIATPDAPVFSMSRAGFGPDEALLYIEVFCGNACGSGRLFALERDDGVWSVTTTVDLFAI